MRLALHYLANVELRQCMKTVAQLQCVLRTFDCICSSCPEDMFVFLLAQAFAQLSLNPLLAHCMARRTMTVR